MQASRLPGKPLIPILGVPMVGHCFYRSNAAKLISKTYIATCDLEIKKYALKIGAIPIKTSRKHKRATTRTAEAYQIIERRKLPNADIIVMIQGDEPLITPQAIDSAVSAFKDPDVKIVNIMSLIKNNQDFNNKNNVKVVIDKNNNALFFSREPIPCFWSRKNRTRRFMQTGIIAFRKKNLIKFLRLKETAYEKTESIDMNRILENGGKVKMILTKKPTIGVDTKDDLKKAKALLKADNLYKKYCTK